MKDRDSDECRRPARRCRRTTHRADATSCLPRDGWPRVLATYTDTRRIRWPAQPRPWTGRTLSEFMAARNRNDDSGDFGCPRRRVCRRGQAPIPSARRSPPTNLDTSCQIHRRTRPPRPNWRSQTTFRCPVKGGFGPQKEWFCDLASSVANCPRRACPVRKRYSADRTCRQGRC